jgi:hypothetical protein
VDSRKTDVAPPGTVAGDTTSAETLSEATGASGYVEHTVQGLILREDEDVLHIEEAKLQRGAGGDVDLVFVEAVIRGAAEDRDCFLMEGPDWFATERMIETGDVSHQPRRMESFWVDELSTEEFFSGNKYTKVFQENEHPEGRAADPRETPFFALCFKYDVPSGADRSITSREHPERPNLRSLFTQVRGIGILRTSPLGGSRKFATSEQQASKRKHHSFE